MSELLAVADDLVAGKLVRNVACPSCGVRQSWWVPGRQLTNIHGTLDPKGLTCGQDECGYRLGLPFKPPDIMCSVCGDILNQTGTTDIKFLCQGCGRTVTP